MGNCLGKKEADAKCGSRNKFGSVPFFEHWFRFLRFLSLNGSARFSLFRFRFSVPFRFQKLSGFINCLLGGRAVQVGSANRNPFARNAVRCPKNAEKLRFSGLPHGRFLENELRCPKTEVKLRFSARVGNPFCTK